MRPWLTACSFVVRTLTLFCGEGNAGLDFGQMLFRPLIGADPEVICANDGICVGSAKWTVRGGHMARTGADWAAPKDLGRSWRNEHQIRLRRVQITEAMQQSLTIIAAIYYPLSFLRMEGVACSTGSQPTHFLKFLNILLFLLRERLRGWTLFTRSQRPLSPTFVIACRTQYP